MDKCTATTNIIVRFNQYQDREFSESEMIKEVCDYYDLVKNEPLSCADKQFLFNIANSIGIPHYFDTLKNFNERPDLDTFSLETFANCLRETQLYTDNMTKLHRYQKEILDKFQKGIVNRYFLSASTSFGKTFLVYEIIYKMEYKNVLLIFPSIALLSENLEKIFSDSKYSAFKNSYEVNTISNGEVNAEKKNLFLFTPERYLSFLDFHNDFKFDFVFIDEVYKMDNDYIIDEETKENERDVAYRLALFYSLIDRTKDALLAGPYIEFSNNQSPDYNPSFDRFMEDCRITLLNYNQYEIVNKEFIKISENQKIAKYKKQVKEFINKNESVIVYCATRADVEKYATYIIKDQDFLDINTNGFHDFYDHLNSVFNNSIDWVVYKALKKGIGIHHGLVPKFIQKEIINLFNQGILKILISTTTITEGVNTIAKNVLILSHQKGRGKELKTFDALNIAGRAGRFLTHYKGNVYSLDKKYIEIKDGKGEPLKHKNYDENSSKNDLDILYTKDIYLNNNDKEKKTLIEQDRSLNVPTL